MVSIPGFRLEEVHRTILTTNNINLKMFCGYGKVPTHGSGRTLSKTKDIATAITDNTVCCALAKENTSFMYLIGLHMRNPNTSLHNLSIIFGLQEHCDTLSYNYYLVSYTVQASCSTTVAKTIELLLSRLLFHNSKLTYSMRLPYPDSFSSISVCFQ